jgi:hypothetical protein
MDFCKFSDYFRYHLFNANISIFSRKFSLTYLRQIRSFRIRSQLIFAKMPKLLVRTLLCQICSAASRILVSR